MEGEVVVEEEGGGGLERVVEDGREWSSVVISREGRASAFTKLLTCLLLLCEPYLTLTLSVRVRVPLSLLPSKPPTPIPTCSGCRSHSHFLSRFTC